MSALEVLDATMIADLIESGRVAAELQAGGMAVWPALLESVRIVRDRARRHFALANDPDLWRN